MDSDSQDGSDPRGEPWTATEWRLFAIVFALGAGLRLWRFAIDRSLWLDEVWLANNISSRSYRELLLPLTDDQEAPVAFLALIKSLTLVFGQGEWVWRSVALVSGLLSLPLFIRVARGWLRTRALLLAFALLALSPPLIHYACETKPYASDALVTIGLLLAWRRYEESGRTRSTGVVFALTGAVAVWFSYPSFFVLGGLGLLSAWRAWRAGGMRKSASALFPAGAWLASFVLLFVLALRLRMDAAGLKDYWAEAFMPFPPTSFDDLRWYPRAFFGLFRDVTGIELRGLAGALFVIGLLAVRRENVPAGAAALAALGLALVASGLGAYPFEGRLALWSAPLLLIPLAAGAELVCRRLEPVLRGASVALVVALFLYAARDEALDLSHGRSRQGIVPVLEQVQAGWEEGDELLLCYGVEPAFDYYAPEALRGAKRHVADESGRDLLPGFIEDVLSMRGQGRVWVLFTHIWSDRTSSLDEDYVDILRRFASEKAHFNAVESSVYLFDFGEESGVEIASNE